MSGLAIKQISRLRHDRGKIRIGLGRFVGMQDLTPGEVASLEAPDGFKLIDPDGLPLA